MNILYLPWGIDKKFENNICYIRISVGATRNSTNVHLRNNVNTFYITLFINLCGPSNITNSIKAQIQCYISQCAYAIKTL